MSIERNGEIAALDCRPIRCSVLLNNHTFPRCGMTLLRDIV